MRTRLPRAERERQMLDTARGLFAAHGYAATSVALGRDSRASRTRPPGSAPGSAAASRASGNSASRSTPVATPMRSNIHATSSVATLPVAPLA